MELTVNNVVCDAEESDWLDVSYTERKYINKKPAKKAKGKFVFTKGLKILAVCLLCVAILGAMLLIDGDFSKEVFATVKTVFTSALSVFVEPTPVNNTITLPVNVNLVDSAQGVSTFGGGKAILSFTNGIVKEVSENTVTVAIDEDTTITYNGLISVFVAVGDSIQANALLGKYDGTFSTVISEKGQVVEQVVASETQLTWQV